MSIYKASSFRELLIGGYFAFWSRGKKIKDNFLRFDGFYRYSSKRIIGDPKGKKEEAQDNRNLIFHNDGTGKSSDMFI